MTPQERQLVDDLFERLAKLENAPRDPEAEQAIRAGLAKAPNAVYALVQTVLVQDEALKRADARIRELEGTDAVPEGTQPKGFLDSMRDALFGGHDERRGSVPTVRPGDQPMGVPPQYRSAPYPGATGPQGPAPYPQETYRSGGSFLGTAAAAAAGVIGGGLLLSGIRSMLGGGGNNQGPFAGTFDQIAPRSADVPSSPWDPAGGGDLARQAGIDDIGGSRQAAYDDGERQSAGLLGSADNDAGDDDADFGGDGGDGGDGGSDYA